MSKVLTTIENWCCLFPGTNPQRSMMVGAWLEQQRLTNDELKALDILVKENEPFFPVINTLVKHIKTLRGYTGIQAYRIATRAASLHGAYHSIQFEDSKIADTIYYLWGSWEAFCQDTQPDNFRQKQFVETYETIYTNRTQGYLSGIYEKQDSRYAVYRITPSTIKRSIETKKAKEQISCK